MSNSTGPSARCLFSLLCLSIIPASAQAPADTVQFGWNRQASGLLNLSQSYYDNWVKGGSDALTWELNFQGAANLEREGFRFENKGKIAYGQTKIGDKGSRKSSDEWNLESIYTWKLGKWVNPFVSAVERSQFTAGYKYDDEAGTRALTSEFFDPAYFFQTAGAGITPVENLKERLGVTLKETFSADNGYADDVETADEIEDFKIEYGLSSVTEYQITLMENILAATRLEVFVNFKGLEDVDGRWENRIIAKVNKLISVNLELDMLYDIDQSESGQTRESLSVGIAFLSL